ncbi:MAG: type II secretion system F family protein [Vulcanimicrobiota bacterium]
MSLQLVEATRFLAISCRLGQPLDEALRLVGEPELAEAVASGDTLGQALARQPERFSEYYRAVVTTAERTPEPAAVLSSLSDWLELKDRLDRRLVAALSYPLMVLDGIVCLLVFLLGYILPVVVWPMLVAANLSPPNAVWLQVAAIALAAATAALHTWTQARARVLAALPWLTHIRRKAQQSLWLRSMATLIAGGRSLHESLPLAEAVLEPGESAPFQQLSVLMERGLDLAGASAGLGLDPVVRVALTSEHHLADELLLGANILETEVEYLTEKAQRLCRPLALLLLGLPVALALVAFWAPFYTTTGMLGGQR